MIKKIGMVLFTICILIGCMWCFKGTKQTIASTCYEETVENSMYLRCNATSYGNMAETQLGYYYHYNGNLYYIDKETIDEKQVTCNHEDCFNRQFVLKTNYTGLLAQKNGKLYGIDVDRLGEIYVFEINMDTYDMNRVYTLPLPQAVTAFQGIVTQNQIVVYYGYEVEEGAFQRDLVNIENQIVHTLLSETIERVQSQVTLSAKSYYSMRGQDAMISSLLTEEMENHWNVLWRIENDNIEKIDFSEDIPLKYGCLEENTFLYFKENEGFYSQNLVSKETKLIVENQLENSKGYVLTEDYRIECNRYNGVTPEQARLAFYDGEQWKDVELPEKVKLANGPFYPVSVASDRIFFAHVEEEYVYLYSFLIEAEKPKLVCCLSVKR